MNRKIINIAISAAKNSDMRQKVGAVVFRGGEIIGIGYNSTKTHPKQLEMARRTRSSEFKIHLHAETAALLKCRGNTEGASILVVRLMRNRYKSINLGLSKPCPMCQEAIRLAGIRDVYFVDPNNVSDEDMGCFSHYEVE